MIDLENMNFSLPEARFVRLCSLRKSTEKSFLQSSEMDSLVGYLSFGADFLPLGHPLLKNSELGESPLVPLGEELRQARS